MSPTDDCVSKVTDSDAVSVPSRERNTTYMSLHQSCYADSLTPTALIRTAPGKEGLLHRDTHSETTTTAWNEGPKELRLLFLFLFLFCLFVFVDVLCYDS